MAPTELGVVQNGPTEIRKARTQKGANNRKQAIQLPVSSHKQVYYSPHYSILPNFINPFTSSQFFILLNGNVSTLIHLQSTSVSYLPHAPLGHQKSLSHTKRCLVCTYLTHSFHKMSDNVKVKIPAHVKGPHISEQPFTWQNWHQHVNWLNTYFVVFVPLMGFVGAYWTPLHLYTAIFSVFYYAVTGIGITAGKLTPKSLSGNQMMLSINRVPPSLGTLMLQSIYAFETIPSCCGSWRYSGVYQNVVARSSRTSQICMSPPPYTFRVKGSFEDTTQVQLGQYLQKLQVLPLCYLLGGFTNSSGYYQDRYRKGSIFNSKRLLVLSYGLGSVSSRL